MAASGIVTGSDVLKWTAVLTAPACTPFTQTVLQLPRHDCVIRGIVLWSIASVMLFTFSFYMLAVKFDYDNYRQAGQRMLTSKILQCFFLRLQNQETTELLL